MRSQHRADPGGEVGEAGARPALTRNCERRPDRRRRLCRGAVSQDHRRVSPTSSNVRPRGAGPEVPCRVPAWSSPVSPRLARARSQRLVPSSPRSLPARPVSIERPWWSRPAARPTSAPSPSPRTRSAGSPRSSAPVRTRLCTTSMARAARSAGSSGWAATRGRGAWVAPTATRVTGRTSALRPARTTLRTRPSARARPQCTTAMWRGGSSASAPRRRSPS